MKNNSTMLFRLGILFLFILLGFQTTNAQDVGTIDSSSSSYKALQFQILGSLGINYIGSWNSTPHFRIGVDFSLNNSNQSGNGVGYSNSFYAFPSQTIKTYSNSPQGTTNSYSFSFSGLYLLPLFDFTHTAIYSGIGPLGSYSWYRNNNKSPNVKTYYSNTAVEEYEYTTKISTLGSLAVLGVRSRLIGNVSLTAGFSCSFTYQWNMQSNSTTITDYIPDGRVFTYKLGSVTNLEGKDISINSLQIGFQIEL